MRRVDSIIFDFAGTLVQMRPAKLLFDKNVLKKLSKSYTLSIVTGGKRSDVYRIVNKLTLSEIFTKNNIFTAEDFTVEKPNPILLKQAKRCLKAKEILYIGDTAKDRKMAMAANVEFLNISTIHGIITTLL